MVVFRTSSNGIVLRLLDLGLKLAFHQLCVNIVGLVRTVSQRKAESELPSIDREIVVENLRLRCPKTSLVETCHRDADAEGTKKPAIGYAIGVDNWRPQR